MQPSKAPEYVRAYMKEYRTREGISKKNNVRNLAYRAKPENWAKSLYWKAKARAKQLERDFEIELSDIIIPEFCPILGIKIEKGVGKVGPSSPTLDRIDSSSGYVKGNIAVISHRANQLKSDVTIEQLEKLLEYAKKGKTWALTH